MKISAINNESDYENALIELEKIFDAEKGTKEGEELKTLSDLLWNYEEINYRINDPDPEEERKFRAEQMGDVQG